MDRQEKVCNFFYYLPYPSKQHLQNSHSAPSLNIHPFEDDTPFLLDDVRLQKSPYILVCIDTKSL
jgi:hypothetical protein